MKIDDSWCSGGMKPSSKKQGKIDRCPVCGRRLKITATYDHFDKHVVDAPHFPMHKPKGNK